MKTILYDKNGKVLMTHQHRGISFDEMCNGVIPEILSFYANTKRNNLKGGKIVVESKKATKEFEIK